MSRELNQFHERTLETLNDTAKGFYDTLRSVPVVSDEHLAYTMQLPGIVP